MKAAVFGVTVVLTILAGSPLRADMINFDDLTGEVDLHAISPYQGFNWSEDFLSSKISAGGYGVMDSQLALNANETSPIFTMSVAAPSFDALSLDMISAWRTWNTYRVEGLLGSAVKDSMDVQVTPFQVSHVILNFVGIDTLRWTHLADSGIDVGPGSGSHIAIDNIEFVPMAIPPPAAVLLGAIGLGLVGWARKRLQ